jgi:hypothetical protein
MDINGDGKSDLVRVWRWNDRTIAGTFTSNGNGYNLTSIEDLGGWADNIKNIATDINGDGKSDLVRIWNNSGKAYAATYISNGGNVDGRVFSIGNNVEVGDWSDQSDAFSMDINGDGKLDLVRVWKWNDRSIAGIYISNGKDYTLAGVEDMGGWADNIKNLPMDISGDNKADLVRVWNNGGKAYAATYISNGGSVNGRVFSIGNNVNIGDWMEDLDVVTLPARSNIDSPSNGQSINSDQDVNVTGWAVAPRLKEVQIFVDNNFVKLANYGLVRADANKAYPGYATGDNCGYSSNIGKISPGSHTIAIKVVSENGQVLDQKNVSINIVQVQVLSQGEQIVAYAKQFLGVPYVYGANGPNSFDCSSFTKYVYAHFGINLPRVANQQKLSGSYVAASELKPGDLLCWDWEFDGEVDHVGIYIGNGQFIQAHGSPSKPDKVVISSLPGYYAKYLVNQRRFFN